VENQYNIADIEDEHIIISEKDPEPVNMEDVDNSKLSTIEQSRLRISQSTDASRKSHFGQFFTPSSISQFMASLFPSINDGICRLIDPGAGIGSLSSAFIERCIAGDLAFERIDITAYEIDELLHSELSDTLLRENERLPFTFKIIGGDFISEAVKRILEGKIGFTHAIINPPYKKINSTSKHRQLLRQIDFETVNLYSAFIASTILLMASGGIIVTIIPRSFCNGPYYRAFRNILLDKTSIKHIHLFGSRNKAFKDDDVLQENIIVMLERDGIQDGVEVTTSTDDSFSDMSSHRYAFNRIVSPNDQDRFINIPTSHDLTDFEVSTVFQSSLEDIGINVSTGPVVDFRTKENLRQMPEIGTVPLLYPMHFDGQNIKWPICDSKKPNAILHNNLTEKSLYQNGFYCLVRRFSSKEERRRIVACVAQPDTFNNAEVIGFENHLNVFHINKRGLTKELAQGLAIFLNSTVVDESFRSFNGNTQVNVTDLKRMKYPSRLNLIELGKKAKYINNDQQAIDNLINKLLKCL